MPNSYVITPMNENSEFSSPNRNSLTYFNPFGDPKNVLTSFSFGRTNFNKIIFLIVLIISLAIWIIQSSTMPINNLFLSGLIIYLVGAFLPGCILLVLRTFDISKFESVYSRPGMSEVERQLVASITGLLETLFTVLGAVSSGLFFLGSSYQNSASSDAMQGLVFLILTPLVYHTAIACPCPSRSLLSWIAAFTFSMIYSSTGPDRAVIVLYQVLTGTMLMYLHSQKVSLYERHLKYAQLLFESNQRGDPMSNESVKMTPLELLAAVSSKTPATPKESTQSIALRAIIMNVSHDMISPLQALEMGLEALHSMIRERVATFTSTISMSSNSHVSSRILNPMKPSSLMSSKSISIMSSKGLPVMSSKTALIPAMSSKIGAGPVHSTGSPLLASKSVKGDLLNAFSPQTSSKSDMPHAAANQNLLYTSVEVYEAQYEIVQTMRSTLSFMSMIIDRSLDSSRATAGLKLVPNIEKFEIKESISKVIRCVACMQSSVMINVNYEFKQHALLISSDRRWFEGNVLCVVSNAVKYSSQSEEFPIEVLVSINPGSVMKTQSVTSLKSLAISSKDPSSKGPSSKDPSSKSTNIVGTEPEKDHIRFEVIDSGDGLTEEQIGRLFHAAEAGSRSAVGGMGLGLFTLAERVQALGGYYGAKSRDDGVSTGSSIWFSFPAQIFTPPMQARTLKNGMSSKVVASSNLAAAALTQLEPTAVREPSPQDSIKSAEIETIVSHAITSIPEAGSDNSNNEEEEEEEDYDEDSRPVITEDFIDLKDQRAGFISFDGDEVTTTLWINKDTHLRSSASDALDKTSDINLTTSPSPIHDGSFRTSLASIPPQKRTSATGTIESYAPLRRTAPARTTVGSPMAGSPTESSPIITSGRPLRSSGSGRVRVEDFLLSVAEAKSLLLQSAKSQRSGQSITDLKASGSNRDSASTPASPVAVVEPTPDVAVVLGVADKLSAHNKKKEEEAAVAATATATTAAAVNSTTAVKATEPATAPVAPAPIPTIVSVPIVANAHQDSTVTTLTEDSKQSTPPPAPTPVAPRTRENLKMNVLVVDDSLPIVRMTQMSLEKAGHVVESAKNGKIAVDMMKDKVYDVVLMDIQMPVMGGPEAVRTLRAIELERESADTTKFSSKGLMVEGAVIHKRQFIIGMSANGDAATREDALNSGMDAFLPKPFSLEGIMRVVAEHVISTSTPSNRSPASKPGN